MDEMTLTRLRELNLNQMARRLEEMRDDPKCHDLNWKDAVASMVDTEYDHRSSRRLQELLRQAHLKYPAPTRSSPDYAQRGGFSRVLAGDPPGGRGTEKAHTFLT